MTSKYVKPNLFIHFTILTSVSESQDKKDKRLSVYWPDAIEPDLDFSSMAIPYSKKLDPFKRREYYPFKETDFNSFLCNGNHEESDSVFQTNVTRELFDIFSTTGLASLVTTLKEIFPSGGPRLPVDNIKEIKLADKPELLMPPKKEMPADEQFQTLTSHVKHRKNGFNKITVPTTEGFELIPAYQLLRCEAQNNYTHLYLKNKIVITACRTLKEMEEQLQDFASFVRVHHSHLVNLNEVIRYVRGEGGYLVMSDGSTVNVSRRRKDALLKCF